ncbi:hypothetical protein [Nitrosomonas communis]|nr:hypothetical protein [Nitrosomonas communis]MCO6428727.1 hypothetical protein [Nitrosomonas communis]
MTVADKEIKIKITANNNASANAGKIRKVSTLAQLDGWALQPFHVGIG